MDDIKQHFHYEITDIIRFDVVCESDYSWRQTPVRVMPFGCWIEDEE